MLKGLTHLFLFLNYLNMKYKNNEKIINKKKNNNI